MMKNTSTHPCYFMHTEHGYIVTYEEMMEIMREEYDADDTNVCDWREYFEETIFSVADLEIYTEEEYAEKFGVK